MYTIKGNKIYFDKDFKVEDLEFLGSGANAKVYKIKIEDKWYALKIFSEYELWHDSWLEDKLDLNLESFIEPLKLVYINDIFCGYIMEYCKTKTILEEKPKLSIDEIVLHSLKLYEDTDKLSERQIIIQDEGVKNTVFENGFKLIDLDHYYKCPLKGYFKDLDVIKDFNRQTITRLLINVYFHSVGLEGICYEDDKLKEKRDECLEGKMSLEDFLKKIACKI